MGNKHRLKYPIEQLELLEKHVNLKSTLADFTDEFNKLFVKPDDRGSTKAYYRIRTLWYKRGEYMEKFKAEKEARARMDRTVMIPAQIRSKCNVDTSTRHDSLPDVGEQLTTLINLTAEFIQIQKESLQIQKEQLNLFAKLAAASAGKKEEPTGNTEA